MIGARAVTTTCTKPHVTPAEAMMIDITVMTKPTVALPPNQSGMMTIFMPIPSTRMHPDVR